MSQFVRASRQENEAGVSGPEARHLGGGGEDVGRWMLGLAGELFPICRSITGDGLRATLGRIQQEIPIALHEIPSGTPVLDWTIPEEWNIRDAWIEDARGERIVDFK